MTLFRSFLVAAVLLVGGVAAVPHAHAQTNEQLQEVGRWTVDYQRLVAAFLAPLENPPEPPTATMSRTQRLTWAGATREWASSAQATFMTARTDLRQMPPFPLSDNAELYEATQLSTRRLGESIDAGDRIVSAYLALADAVERNQMSRVNDIRRVALEGTMVTMRLFQDINASQAAAIEAGNPNRSLLLSFSYSYEALWMVMNFKYELSGGAGNRAAAANAIASAAQRMRVVIGTGRADTALLQSQLADPAIAATIGPVLLPRLRAMIATFPSSFAREEELAADLDVMAELLRRPGDFVPLEPTFDAQMIVYADREALRREDLLRRSAIMAAP